MSEELFGSALMVMLPPLGGGARFQDCATSRQVPFVKADEFVSEYLVHHPEYFRSFYFDNYSGNEQGFFFRDNRIFSLE